MTVSTTSRLGLYRWDSGGDPFTRSQMDSSHQALEEKASGFAQGSTGSRPAASSALTGFFYFDTSTSLISYCDGSDWYSIAVPSDSVEDLDGSTSSVGTSSQYAREDHIHAISADAITSTQLATNSVTTDKISASAVTTAKINNAAVTNDKLGTDISAAKLVVGTLSMDRIAAGAITDAKLASGIDAAKLTGTLSTDRISDDSISLAKIQNSSALSVLGRSANSVGDAADIVAGTDGYVLRRSGTTLGFGQVVAAGIANDSVALGTKTTGDYVQSLTAGSGISIAGGTGEGSTPTISHSDTSTQSSIDNSGVTVVQDLTFDTYGHVTGATSVDLTEGIQDIVGAMVSSNTESGISVTYQDTDGTLDFNVNDPVITLTGDVTGSATMTNLGNVSISTTVGDDSHTHDTRYYTESEINTKLGTLYGTSTGSGGYWVTYGTGGANNGDGAPNGSIYLKYV